MSHADLDRQFSPSSLVADLPAILAGYASRSARARARLPVHTDLPYGPGLLDFFPASRTGAPLLVYVHGGFWQEMSKDDFAFPAMDLVPAGAAYAVLGYGLAPAHDLDEIVAAVRTGLSWLAANARSLGVDPDRIHLCGHSAGAHLVAMALLTGRADLFAGVTLLSGIYDLEPIRRSYVNDALGLDSAATARNSPIRTLVGDTRLNRLPPLILACGGRETDEFLRQQKDFAAAAALRGGSVLELVVGHRHHFDIMDDLADSDTELGAAVLDQLRLRHLSRDAR
jgi:arylformamidase